MTMAVFTNVRAAFVILKEVLFLHELLKRHPAIKMGDFQQLTSFSQATYADGIHVIGKQHQLAVQSKNFHLLQVFYSNV